MSTQAELIKDCILEIEKLEVMIELETLKGNHSRKELLEEMLAKKRYLLENIKFSN